jgi:predicted secreted protein with PEFG-CTERM motif
MKTLQLSIIVILSLVVISIDDAFAEKDNNINNFGDLSQNSMPINQSPQNPNSTDMTSQSNSVSSDKKSYHYGDTISITGSFSKLYNNTILNFFVFNPNQETISNHGFIGGSDGRFDALVVANGPKWNQSGIYTIILKSSQSTIAQTSFSFTGQEVSTPEFGSISITIVTVSIIGTVIISRRFKLDIHE